MKDYELLEHFVKIGQFEGRKCNSKFNVILPDYYRDKLNLIGMLYFLTYHSILIYIIIKNIIVMLKNYLF